MLTFKKNQLTLLIDADLLVYKLSYSNLVKLELPDGRILKSCDMPMAKHLLKAELNGLLDKFNTNKYCLFLSPVEGNFRKEIEPTYKGNRTEGKPAGYDKLRKYMMDNFKSDLAHNMEADDALARKATGPSPAIGEDHLIISADKDLLGVPAKVYHLGSKMIFEATEDQAMSFSLVQAIMGDRVDGYPGIPGKGKAWVEKFLEQYHGMPFRYSVEDAGLDWNQVCHQWRLSKMLWFRHREYPQIDLKEHTPESWLSGHLVQSYMPYLLPGHTNRFGQKFKVDR